MKLLKNPRTIARSWTQSVQVKLALASGSVVGMILAAVAGGHWN
jgi:hypothetical protein